MDTLTPIYAAAALLFLGGTVYELLRIWRDWPDVTVKQAGWAFAGLWLMLITLLLLKHHIDIAPWMY